MRVLLVEDHIAVATSTVMLLELLGHTVKHAANGQEALSVASDFAPDIMLIDIGLPDMDGYTLGDKLRMIPELRDTVMVALTGYDCEEKVKAHGFNHYCKKPMDMETLDTLVATKKS